MRALVLAAMLAGCTLPLDQGEVEGELIVTDLDWVCLREPDRDDPPWPHYDSVMANGDVFAAYSSVTDTLHKGDLTTGEMLIDSESYWWTFGLWLQDGCVSWQRGRCCYR